LENANNPKHSMLRKVGTAVGTQEGEM